jgi:hypothetical protein
MLSLGVYGHSFSSASRLKAFPESSVPERKRELTLVPPWVSYSGGALHRLPALLIRRDADDAR